MLDFSRIPNNYVVQCVNLEDALDFASCFKMNYPEAASTWSDEKVKFAYRRYKKNFCFNPNYSSSPESNPILTYCDRKFYENSNMNVMQFEELVIDDTFVDVSLDDFESLVR